MKKIIATVLAMVMALALCTTAFAAVKYTGYDKDGDEITTTKYTYEVVDANYDEEGNDNNVEYYVVTDETGDDTYYVKSDVKDYDLKLKAPGKADLYLSSIDTAADADYYAVATEFTNIGKKCCQLDGSKKATYYAATYVNDDDEKVVEYYKADEAGTLNLLVGGKLVAVDNAAIELVPHTWEPATYDDDDNVTSYKCKDCGITATVYKTYEAAKASGSNTYNNTEVEGTWIGYNDACGTTTTTTTATSPKTFDAGIAMYVGMALTSVAGSAVVIGKKKEF